MIPPSVATNLATTPFLSQREDKAMKHGKCGAVLTFWGKSGMFALICQRGPGLGPHSLRLILLPDLDQLRGDASVQQHPVHQLHVTWTATHHWGPDTLALWTNCARAGPFDLLRRCSGGVWEGRAEV